MRLQQLIAPELAGDEIKLASSFTNAQNGVFINSVSNLEEFNIISRVSDKKPNDAGHPIQYDGLVGLFIRVLQETQLIVVVLLQRCIQMLLTQILVIF